MSGSMETEVAAKKAAPAKVHPRRTPPPEHSQRQCAAKPCVVSLCYPALCLCVGHRGDLRPGHQDLAHVRVRPAGDLLQHPRVPRHHRQRALGLLRRHVHPCELATRRSSLFASRSPGDRPRARSTTCLCSSRRSRTSGVRTCSCRTGWMRCVRVSVPPVGKSKFD